MAASSIAVQRIMSGVSLTLTIIALISRIGATFAQGTYGDNRCFLESGGSAESFFVSEDLPVGSVIGTLRIIGDPSERGNILLRLQERDSPVVIVPGTKNISLTRRLDKEGVEGPSSVYINVICDRRRAGSDPGFVIPVNIRVTDANDNAPQFLNAPYVLNISEVTVVGTRVLQGVRAVDADQQGPFSTVHYTVLPGPHSDYFVFVNGLEGTLLLRKPLDYETLSNFTIRIRAQDQGSPPQHSDTTLQVNVIDADDQNPRFRDERYTAVLPEPPLQGTRLQVKPREIAAYDQDLGINARVYYTFNSVGADYRLLDLDRETGAVTLRRSLGVEELRSPAVLVLRATQADNPDRYALATLTVERAPPPLPPPPRQAPTPGASAPGAPVPGAPVPGTGAPAGVVPAPGATAPPPPRFLQRVFRARAPESLPPGSLLLTALTNRPRDKRLRFWLEGVAAEQFAVSNTGELTLRRPLDFETQDAFAFSLHVGDGARSDSARVEVAVDDVNDWEPRFRYPQYEFLVEADARAGSVVGRVEAADGDRGDALRLTLRGPDARMFRISDSGEIALAMDLRHMNATGAHLIVVASDSGTPPHETAVPVVVRWGGEGAGEARGRAASAPTLLVLLGALLGLLALAVMLLLAYICRNKRRKTRDKDPAAARSFLAAEQGAPKDKEQVDNPIFSAGGAGANEQPTYTATVKSIMARTALGRGGAASEGEEGATKRTAPAPPQLPTPAPAPAPAPAPDGGGGGSPGDEGTDGEAWATGSIPRRVKKLSWDDEPPPPGACSPRALRRHPPQPELDPALSVIPLSADETTADQANLTVYF